MKLSIRTLLVLPCLVLALVAGACGGGGSSDPKALTDEGYAALGTSDYDGALESFQKALAEMDSAHAQFKRAKMGEIEALIHVDAERAKDEFIAMAGSMSGSVTAKDYQAIASKMTSEKKYVPAIAVLDAGIKAHAENPKLLAIMEKVKSEAEKAGDSGALDALRGLGYL